LTETAIFGFTSCRPQGLAALTSSCLRKGETSRRRESPEHRAPLQAFFFDHPMEPDEGQHAPVVYRYLTVAHDEITVTVQAPMRAGDLAAFSPAG